MPNGERPTFTVKGIFDPPPGGSPFGPRHDLGATFDKLYTQPQDQFVFLNVDGGVTKANDARLDQVLKGFPNAKVQDRGQFKKNQASFLGDILNILYVLLALSVIVSLFGIVNTLVLTIFERTRELGMLRAVGMTRWQVRWMITLESVVTALIGAVIGIVLGIVLVGAADRPRGLPRPLVADRLADRLRARRDRGRGLRSDLPGTAGGTPERARALQYE